MRCPAKRCCCFMTDFAKTLSRISADSKSRLILSLDISDKAKAIACAAACAKSIVAVKLHQEMPLYWKMTHADAVAQLKKASGNKPIILDAKLADIDSSNAFKSAYYFDAGYDAIICHGFSGKDAVAAVAAEAKKRKGKGVFLLTSMTTKENLFGTAQTARLCAMAKAIGVDGAVSPGNDYERTALVRRMLGKDSVIISPGIGKQGGDAAMAVAAGCDYFIVGRSIIQANDCGTEAEKLAKSVQQAIAAGAPAPAKNTSLLSTLVAKNVLRFGDFTLKSGRKSTYFFNTGNLDDGESLEAVGNAFALCAYENGLLDKFDVVFGPAYKGIPLATTVARSINEMFGENKRFAYDRKEGKDYGDTKDKVVVGNLKPGDRLLFVDDVITTGKTKYETVEKLRKAGFDFSVAGVVVLFDREETDLEGNDPKAQMEKVGLKPYCVLTAHETFAALSRPQDGKPAVIDKATYDMFAEHQKAFGTKKK